MKTWQRARTTLSGIKAKVNFVDMEDFGKAEGATLARLGQGNKGT